MFYLFFSSSSYFFSCCYYCFPVSTRARARVYIYLPWCAVFVRQSRTSITLYLFLHWIAFTHSQCGTLLCRRLCTSPPQRAYALVFLLDCSLSIRFDFYIQIFSAVVMFVAAAAAGECCAERSFLPIENNTDGSSVNDLQHIASINRSKHPRIKYIYFHIILYTHIHTHTYAQ